MAEDFLHGIDTQDIDDGGRTITVASSSVIGIVGTAPKADPVAFPLDTPVLVTGTAKQLAALVSNYDISGDGTLPDALDSIFEQAGAVVVVVRVEAAADDAQTMANVIGGVSATTGQFSGVHALLAAEHEIGVKPRILIAPGFTHQMGGSKDNPTANPVIAELKGIADRLRAAIVQDGPSTTDAAALKVAKDAGSKRIYLVDPRSYKTNSAGVTVPAWSSAVTAGTIALSDSVNGWWASPSNTEIYGIVGTERPIPFALGDKTSNANLLNQGNVTTIIRQNGFRLWGNRTLSADPKWKFLCVVRTADIIVDAIQAAHLWAVDRGITKTYVEDVRERVNAFLRDLKTKGAILGGKCWLDPELNSAASIAEGHVYWDFDFGAVYPGEHLTFRSHLVDNYIAEIF